MLPIMSFRLTPISSTDAPAMISNDGIAGRLDIELHDALVEPAVAQLLAHPLARAARLLAHDGRILAGRGGRDGGSSRSSSRSSAAARAFS